MRKIAISTILGSVLWIVSAASQGQDLVFYDGFAPVVDYAYALQDGQVVLPESDLLDPETLTIETLVAQTTPDSAGGFQIYTFANPHLVLARSAAGNTVLMGLLGSDDNIVDARSTAVLTVFLNANGGALPSDGHLPLLDALDRDPALDGLETAIEDAIVAGPDAFSGYNKPVALALQTTMQQLRQDAGLASLVKDLTILPDDSQSGAELEKQFQAFQLINHYKRPLKVYVDLEQCSGESGVVQAGQGDCQGESADFDVKAVVGGRNLADAINGAINAGYAMFYGEEGTDIPLDPIRSPSSPLPIPGDFDNATYAVFVGGPGGTEGVRDELSPARLDELFKLEVKFMLFDLMIPAVTALVLPSLGNDINRLLGSSNATNLITDVANALNNQAKAAMNAGDYKGAFRILWDEFWANQGTVRQLILDFLERWVSGQVNAGQAADYLEFAQGLNRAMAAFDITIAGLDTTLTYGQILASDRVAKWRVQVTQPEIEIFPSAAEVKCDEDQEFEAQVRDLNGDSDVVFAYHWRIDPDAGVLVDCRGREGTDFTTSCSTVSLRANFVRDLFDLDVTVVANRLDDQPSYEAGKATAVADIQLADVEVLLAPYASSIDNGESQLLEVELRPIASGNRCRTSDLSTQWFNTAEFGQIDVAEGVEVRRDSVTYTANSGENQGADTVSVDVIYQRNDGPFTELGTAEAEIRVEDEPTILDGTLAIIAGPSPGNRVCVGAAVIVPDDPLETEDTRYFLDARHGRDIYFYGTRIRKTAPPYANAETDSYFPGFPAGTRSIGLSAGCGGESSASDFSSWFETRFGSGWQWKIFVTR